MQRSMTTQPPHVIGEIWAWLSEDRRFVEIFAALMILQLLILLLPQAPVSPANDLIYTRWLAEQRLTLGRWTDLLATLQLLFLRSSLWLRGALALLALVLAAHLDALVKAWPDVSPRVRVRGFLPLAGGVLFLLGWGIHTLWGWTEPNLTTWPETPLEITQREITLAPPHRFALWHGVYGLYLIPEGRGLGVEVTASKEDGASLALLPSRREEPQQQLSLVLTTAASDAYFALPEAEYVFRLNYLAESPALRVQAYRSASGELLTEAALSDDTTLSIDEVHLHVRTFEAPQFNAVYNPGAPFEALGLGLLGIGSLLRQLRPAPATEAMAQEGAASPEDDQDEEDATLEEMADT
ncbi:MAG: hypothetical protein ACLFTI_05000 [Anaerolineales bacterium]